MVVVVVVEGCRPWVGRWVRMDREKGQSNRKEMHTGYSMALIPHPRVCGAGPSMFTGTGFNLRRIFYIVNTFDHLIYSAQLHNPPQANPIWASTMAGFILGTGSGVLAAAAVYYTISTFISASTSSLRSE